MQATNVTVGQEDSSAVLARHAVGLKYSQIPPEVVKLTKQCVLDILGVIIGATRLAPESKIVYDFVRDQGAGKEATLLGFGGKSSLAWAAFFNGALGHMLDYDDLGGGGHESVTTVPVGFAVAEKLGKVKGRDFLTAVAAGIDIQSRLNVSIPVYEWVMTEGWFGTQLLGYFSGTAVAGRLMGLNAEQMRNAFGIAFTQVSGSRQMAVGIASHIRGMQGGFTGLGSVLAADLAKRGITGSRDCLEGRYGLFSVYVKIKPDRDKLLGGLGTRFATLEDHSFKVWPACGATLSINDSILDLRREHGIRPRDVEELVVVGGNEHTHLLSNPIESKRRPKTSMDGKYSIPFTAAAAMTTGGVVLGNYTVKGLNDPAVLAMAKRVRHEEIPPEKKTSLVPEVRIRLKDGRTFSRSTEFPQGHPRNPASDQHLKDKFRDCVSYSALRISRDRVDEAIDMVDNLEKLDDVSKIIRVLTPQRTAKTAGVRRKSTASGRKRSS
jgi:2-methylcitrate dehydratase PrpD